MVKLPRIFYYNPTCEMAVGNGLPHYQAPRLVNQLEQELSILMIYLARASDWVLVHKMPSNAFLRSLQQLGIVLPKLVLTDHFFNTETFLTYPKESFEPWGISPAVLSKVQSHFSSFSPSYRHSPVSEWKDEHTGLFSRKFALEVLNAVLEKGSFVDLLEKNLRPQVCTRVSEVEDVLRRHTAVMLKAPWSSSGRGVLRLRKPFLYPSNKQWINGVLTTQGFIMVEPLLDRCIDFSMHFDVQEDEVRSLGTTTFITSDQGQYQGSYLEEFPEGLSDDLQAFYTKERLMHIQEMLREEFALRGISKLFRGVFGVDAMVYRDENAKLRIQPCVEINMRKNMGTITLALRKQFPMSKGFWRTIYAPKNNMIEQKLALEKEYPKHLEDGVIQRGFIALTEMTRTSAFASYLVLT